MVAKKKDNAQMDKQFPCKALFFGALLIANELEWNINLFS